MSSEDQSPRPPQDLNPVKERGVIISENGVRINQNEVTVKKISHGTSLHAYSKEETTAFTTHIINCLANDPLCERHFPIDPESEEIFNKLGDGLILMKIINLAYPGTIDEKKINKDLNMSIYKKKENLNVVLAAAKQIGCHAVFLGGQDIIDGKPTLILGLLWQVIKLQLLSSVNIAAHPEMNILKDENETDAFFAKLPADQILLRWINYHLQRAGETQVVNNFDKDLSDPIVFCKLLHQLDKKCELPPSDLTNIEIAQHAIESAQKLGIETFQKPQDICSGNSKLNMGFVALLFNAFPGLDHEAKEEEERKRLEEEARLLAEAEEVKRLAEEAELKRIADDEEAKRLAEELERRKYTDTLFENSTCDVAVKILTDVLDHKEDLFNLRRWFHMHPELSFQEVNTAAKVAETLRSYGMDEVFEGVGRTGVVALLRGEGGDGPCIALRADMDALPLTETSDVQYKSKNEGVMHACGHDGHMAGLLGAVKILVSQKQLLRGTIKFIFQPAEEGYGGAREMIKDGVLEEGRLGPNVDCIYGLHLWTPANLGEVLVSEGPVMAASDKFEINVKGKGGHGAMPNGTVDAIVEAAALVNSFQTIISRNMDPLEAGVITCGTINGGYGYNLIADSVMITGTTRTMTTTSQELIKTRMCEVCQATAQLYGGEIDLNYTYGYPSTVNAYPECVDIVRKAADKIVGPTFTKLPMRTMGAEDFSYFLQERPGCFFFVGAALPGEKRPHHKSVFDFDESAMLIGASVFVQIIRDLLL